MKLDNYISIYYYKKRHLPYTQSCLGIFGSNKYEVRDRLKALVWDVYQFEPMHYNKICERNIDENNG